MGVRFFSPLAAFCVALVLLSIVSARAADLPPVPGPTVMAPQSAVAGYRGLGVDCKNGGFVFDAVMHGPILGGVIKF